MDLMRVLATAAITVPAVLLALVVGWGLKHAAVRLYRGWRIRRSGIAYESILGNPLMERPHYEHSFYDSVEKAQSLASRLLEAPAEAFTFGGTGITVTGGKTGHVYRIWARSIFPILDTNTQMLLCGLPYNSWSLPYADIMLTQALYLKCPETELDFVEICNKIPHQTGKCSHNIYTRSNEYHDY